MYLCNTICGHGPSRRWPRRRVVNASRRRVSPPLAIESLSSPVHGLSWSLSNFANHLADSQSEARTFSPEFLQSNTFKHCTSLLPLSRTPDFPIHFRACFLRYPRLYLSRFIHCVCCSCPLPSLRYPEVTCISQVFTLIDSRAVTCHDNLEFEPVHTHYTLNDIIHQHHVGSTEHHPRA